MFGKCLHEINSLSRFHSIDLDVVDEKLSLYFEFSTNYFYCSYVRKESSGIFRLGLVFFFRQTSSFQLAIFEEVSKNH